MITGREPVASRTLDPLWVELPRSMRLLRLLLGESSNRGLGDGPSPRMSVGATLLKVGEVDRTGVRVPLDSPDNVGRCRLGVIRRVAEIEVVEPRRGMVGPTSLAEREGVTRLSDAVSRGSTRRRACSGLSSALLRLRTGLRSMADAPRASRNVRSSSLTAWSTRTRDVTRGPDVTTAVAPGERANTASPGSTVRLSRLVAKSSIETTFQPRPSILPTSATPRGLRAMRPGSIGRSSSALTTSRGGRGMTSSRGGWGGRGSWGWSYHHQWSCQPCQYP